MDDQDTSWRENYAGSSGFSTKYMKRNLNGRQQYDVFELDGIKLSFDVCPVLMDVANYNPDFIDLGLDEEARKYWLRIFEEGLDAVCLTL